MKKIFTFLLTLFVCFSVFAKSEPLWVQNAYKGYDEDSFICVVSSGLTSEDADKKALSEIASTLIQSINATENVKQVADSEGKNLSSYLADITTNSDVKNITGLSVKDRYKNKKKIYYSRAVLDKSAAAKYYSVLINKNSLEIETLLDNAKKMEASLSSCKNLIKAFSIAKENDYYVNLLSLLKKSSVKILSYGSSAEIESKIQREFAKILILVQVENSSGSSIYTAANEILNGFGFATKNYSGNENNKDARYIFSVKTDFEDIDKPSSSEIYYTRVKVSCNLTEVESGKSIMTFSDSNRVGKLTRKESQSSAVRNAENIIKESFSYKFRSLIEE